MCYLINSDKIAALTAEDTSLKKCAIILNDTLPIGTASNTAAILGVSFGRHHPEMVGRDLPNFTGEFRHGITTMAIPILKASPEVIRDMRLRIRQFEPDLLVVEVTSATQTTRSYDEYAEAFERTPADEVQFFGLGLFGDKKTVSKFTGGLALLR
jgi:hypothetical protein